MKFFISNISYKVDDEELKEFVISRGLPALEARVVKDIEGKSRGFGFIEIASDDKMLCIAKLNEATLLGRPLRVDLAKERVRNWDDRRRDAAGD